MSRELADLERSFRDQVGEWLRLCNAKGVPVLVFCTWRPPAEQARLYSIGRNEDGSRIPGIRIVTNAKPGESRHNLELEDRPCSEAIDAVPWQVTIEKANLSLKRKLDWTPFDSPQEAKAFRESRDLELLDRRWGIMAKMALKVGMEWAGMWTGFVEYVHFQKAA